METHRRNPKPNAMSGQASGNSRTEPDGPTTPGGRMAVPIFRGRVAPVLDTCTRLLVVEMEDATCCGRQVPMNAQSFPERVQELTRLGIAVIICGALSDHFCSFLEEKKIQLICGIAGDIDEVIAAYREGTLARACFRMPGAAAIPPSREPSVP
jgi:hypothetical protein